MSENQNAVIVKTPVAVGEKGVQINDIEGLWRFSNYVKASGLAPKGITSAESIFIAIQMGFEVGLTPMAALQNIAPINGRPSLWGDAQLAVVRGSGFMCFYAEEETNNELHGQFVDLCLEEDETKRKDLIKAFARAQAKITRKGDDWGFSVATQRKDERIRFGRFTVEDAKTAGLWQKEGPWRQYPQRMLKSRARAFLLRDVYGDALKGILSAEEAQDLPFQNAKPVEGFTMPVSRPPVIPFIPHQSDPTPEPEPPTKQLLAWLDASATPFETFAQWAKSEGHINDVCTADEFPDEVAARLLRSKDGVLKRVQAFQEEAMATVERGQG